jgi:tripartite-type tricarboxylate transporter receptor subunit TctC
MPARNAAVYFAGVAALCAGIALGAAALAADAAKPYPSRAVRMIVPFAAGGPTDIIARIVAQRASEIFGRQIYVENLPGAGGNLGIETAARAAADGYTILVVSTGFVINTSMYAKLKYDPFKNFAPITLVAASPNIITVTPSLPVKTLKALIALVKANPGKYSFADPATGSTPHLAGELFKQQYGLDLVTVPFNGAGPAINSTMGGYTQVAFTALPPVVGNIMNGSVRGIAILAKERSPEVPDVPTSGESGVPDLESDTLTGLAAPAGAPQEIIDKWYRAVAQMVAEPATKERLDKLGFKVVGNTPTEFTERLKFEMERWGKVVRAANIRAD